VRDEIAYRDLETGKGDRCLQPDFLAVGFEQLAQDFDFAGLAHQVSTFGIRPWERAGSGFGSAAGSGRSRQSSGRRAASCAHRSGSRRRAFFRSIAARLWGALSSALAA